MGIFTGTQSTGTTLDDQNHEAHVRRMKDEIQILQKDFEYRTRKLNETRTHRARLESDLKKCQHDLDAASSLKKKLEKDLETAILHEKDLKQKVDHLLLDVRKSDDEMTKEQREASMIEADLKQKKKALQNESR